MATTTILFLFVCHLEYVAMQPPDCQSLGYPSTTLDSAGCCRLYTQSDCVRVLGGIWYDSGECLKVGGGSWSYDCRVLNSKSSPSSSPSTSSPPSTTQYQMCGECICPQSLFTCISTLERSGSAGLSYKGAGITGSGSNAQGATIKFCCDQSSPSKISTCKSAGSCTSSLNSAPEADGHLLLSVIVPPLTVAAASLLPRF
jgi:hypothetical protein